MRTSFWAINTWNRSQKSLIVTDEALINSGIACLLYPLSIVWARSLVKKPFWPRGSGMGAISIPCWTLVVYLVSVICNPPWGYLTLSSLRGKDISTWMNDWQMAQGEDRGRTDHSKYPNYIMRWAGCLPAVQYILYCIYITYYIVYIDFVCGIGFNATYNTRPA